MNRVVPHVLRPWVFCLVLSLTSNAFGQATWTNRNSGFWWDRTNWQNGLLPGVGARPVIANQGTKTITVDALLPATNRLVGRLDLSAPGAATNTLLLQDMGTNEPLAIANQDLNIFRGGALVVTNSSLVVTGTLIDFTVFMGSVRLDSGSILVREEPITTNVTVQTIIGRTNAASLTINGGTMAVTKMLVGQASASPPARSHGTVRITGGQLKVSGELSIADGIMCTGIVEMIGGRLLVEHHQTNIMRVADNGFGWMTVSNAVALVGNVSVGRHAGAQGTLILHTNGFMSCADDLSIGRFSGATGTVIVAGGELEIPEHPLWVGREGVGSLFVSNGLLQAVSLHIAIVPTNTARASVHLAGGRTLISSNFILGDGLLSSGSVLMTAGHLLVGNETNSAALIVPVGTMTFCGGSIMTDRLVLTNSTGHLLFNDGTLFTRNTAVSNGAPFVVGDGQGPARLHLLGGTHFFADGLVISNNATLSGCGTIIGTVINHGSIATNCAAQLVAPVLTNALQTGSAIQFSFQGLPGLTYIIEYKKDLNASAWTPLEAHLGNGSQLTVADAISGSRFYRVRVE